MGKLIVAAALALVVGLFVGGLGPRAELARTRKELDEARLAATRAGGSNGVLPFALGGLLSQAGRGQPGRGTPPRFQVPPHQEPVVGGEAAPAPTEAQEGADGGRGVNGTAEAFAVAKAAAALRASQYRSAFAEAARLSPEADSALSAVVAEMNQELGKAATEIGAQLASRTRLAPRDMADIGARVLDVYRRADDRFKASLDQQGREALDKTDFDLLTQIDLGAVEGLAAQLSRLQMSEPSRSAQ